MIRDPNGTEAHIDGALGVFGRSDALEGGGATPLGQEPLSVAPRVVLSEGGVDIGVNVLRRYAATN